MKALRAGLIRLSGLLNRARRERDLADMVESHLQMHIDDNLRSGMTPEEARRDAILKLGGVESTKEAYRDRSTIPFLDNLSRDVRFAFRQLRQNPGFTCTAILVLALGMCAAVSIFAFVDAALIKPLPYRNPSQLVGVYESIPDCPHCNLSYLDYLDWKRMNVVFSSLEVYQHGGVILATATGAEAARSARVSDGFFRTLGVSPVLGRDFLPGEDRPGAGRTALLSYATWQARYGGRKDVLGKTVVLDGVPVEIIGVLPKDFSFAPAEPAEFWTPLHATGSLCQARSCHTLYGVARLKEGISLQAALANTKAIAKRLEEQYPDSNRGQGASVVALSEVIAGDIRPILLVSFGGAGLLLLIAGVNVASLLLVRAESRRRETAVRSALGASSLRLVSQFIAESSVLAVLGTVLGLVLSYWAMQLLAGLIPENIVIKMPYLRGLRLSVRVFEFAGVIALVAIVLFSIAPVLRLSASTAKERLADGSRGSAGTTWRRVGSNLVVLELAIAMVLLTGAGLLGQSLYRLLHVDLGLEPDHLATMLMATPESRYRESKQQVALGRQALTTLVNLPGVEAAGITNVLPVGHNSNTTWFRVLGRPYHGEHNEVPEREVSPGYFTTLRATLLRGRYFREGEDASKPSVAIINESLARQYFSGEDPIGKQISYLSDPPKPIEVVGVVKDVREGALDSEPRSVLYRPFEQSPERYLCLVVRTAQRPSSVLPEIAAALHQLGPGIVTADPVTMSDRINDSPSAYLRRSSAYLLGGFAALALLLGVVGLYGVVSYSVSQRTREIGIRMALGAQTTAVYQLILKEAAWLVAIGIGIGVIGSVAAATLIRGLLFGVRSWDVSTLAAVACVLGVAALLAVYAPARHAASVNPVDALRAE